MNERQKQTVFLKRLLQQETTKPQQDLERRIALAEQDERCVRTAMTIVGLTGLLCVSGLCYEAIFVEAFFINPTLLLTRIFGYVGFGSAICWLMFLGYWLWHRALTNRLYDEGRRLLIARANPPTLADAIHERATSEQDAASKEDTQPAPGRLAWPRAA